MPETLPEQRRLRLHPGLMFVGIFVLTALLERLVPFPLPLPHVAAPVAGMILGAFFLGAWAMVEMRKAKTPIEPNSQPASLVTRGPFRFSRNPLYVSLLTTSTASSRFPISARGRCSVSWTAAAEWTKRRCGRRCCRFIRQSRTAPASD